MSKKNTTPEKTRLHIRNRNRERYDLDTLMIAVPELESFVKPNKYGNDSVDFKNPEAVKTLNKALLHHYYGIQYWEFPDENLCPPIPGRADYLHHVADLLCSHNFGTIPEGEKITCYDIGVGANCIYPIIGVTEYGWNFIGSDVDPKSIKSAQNIVASNPTLKGKVECRLQENPKDIFFGLIKRDEIIDISICNPPYHASAEDAAKGSRRKERNLTGKIVEEATLNFSGVASELVYEGGEYAFINNMIRESQRYKENCYWFTTLVSKQSNLKRIEATLQKFEAKEVTVIPMGTGNKSTRIVAWTFLSKEEQKEWKNTRWNAK